MSVFASTVELFVDEFSRDLCERRAEALKRLARLHSDGFFVHDLPGLRVVLDHAVRRLHREPSIAPGLTSLLQSLSKARTAVTVYACRVVANNACVRLHV